MKKDIQIIHDRRNHWVVASIFECNSTGIVHLYDSLYSTIHQDTYKVIYNLFECNTIVVYFQ